MCRAQAAQWPVPFHLNGTFRHLPMTVNLLLFHSSSPRDDQPLSSRLQLLSLIIFFFPPLLADILPVTIATAFNL